MDPTAKVDIRRLQILNDRIAQTIEALNQVRLSVHGLGFSHSNGVGHPFASVPFQGFQGQGYPFQVPFQNIQGIQHTSPQGYPQTPFGTTFGTGFPGQQTWGQSPYTQTPFGNHFGGGLAHTSPDLQQQQWGQPWGQQQVGIDPYVALRVMQSFPFAQMPNLPVQG